LQRNELVCTYAALLLHDGDLEITEEKLNKVILASGNKVEGYWPGLFAKALRGKDIGALLANAGSSGSAGPAPVAAAAAPVKVEEKKKEAPSKYNFSKKHFTYVRLTISSRFKFINSRWSVDELTEFSHLKLFANHS